MKTILPTAMDIRKFVLLVLLFCGTAQGQNLTFADPWLKAVLLSASPLNNIAFANNVSIDIDVNNDSEISMAEAAVVDRLWLENTAITNIQGIEGFGNLEEISFKGINATNAVLSNLPLLTRISILECPSLASVSAANLAALNQIACMDNPSLTTVAVSNCPLLKTYWMNDNAITSVDVSTVPSLEKLYCDNNQIATMNVTGCLNLREMLVRGNQLTAIDASGLPELFAVLADDNPNLISVDVSECVMLTAISNISLDSCPNLQSIDFSNCTGLTIMSLQSFTNLNTLNFSGCSALVNLMVHGNALTQLILDGCTSLDALQCNENALTTLDLSDCTALRMFNANNNLLTSINFDNCMALYDVQLDHNELVFVDLSNRPELRGIRINHNLPLAHLDLHNCPQLLGWIYVADSQMNYLDVSDCPLLNDVEIGGAPFQTINVQGCLSLSYFAVSGDASTLAPIATLDLSNLPELTTVSIANFALQSLDITNSPQISILTIQNLPMTSIDLPVSTKMLQLTDMNLGMVNLNDMTELQSVTLNGNNNSLQAIFAKNGVQETFFLNGSLSNLEFICQDESALAATQTALSSAGLTDTVCNSYCSFVPGGDYNTITGAILFDLANDGCDALDLPQPNIRIDINDGNNPGATFTNGQGNYSFFTGAGNFNLTPALENPGIFNISPVSSIASFADANNNTATRNFCISANGTSYDVEIAIAPIGQPRPGFASLYQLVIRNKGNQTLSGSYQFTFDDSRMDFALSSTPPNTVAAGALTWTYSNLLPFETRSVMVILNINTPTQVPPVNLGDQLSFGASVEPVANDILPMDNTFVLNQTAVDSYDPNDKTCLEGDQVSTSMIGKYLHYVINFENLGSAEAVNVVVKDVIDTAMFDINTLQVLYSSHDTRTEIRDNTVEFKFSNINLAPAAGDPPVGGHGTIMFKIKTRPSLENGSAVENTANIFFDYNAAIGTNTARTVFGTLSSTGFEKDLSVALYPNPVTDVINIRCESIVKAVELFDVQGRLIQTATDNRPHVQINISDYASGIYFVRVTTQAGQFVHELVKQ